ncbi:hypothetical protein M5K25_012102 [Dendrobium thyrsiflorum]|uniref:Uncharacterized protein n=1 Tax=Dendrobium thyrsiflorum TaxID=117978 RepID=A0ABD0V340_DENTH
MGEQTFQLLLTVKQVGKAGDRKASGFFDEMRDKQIYHYESKIIYTVREKSVCHADSMFSYIVIEYCIKNKVQSRKTDTKFYNGFNIKIGFWKKVKRDLLNPKQGEEGSNRAGRRRRVALTGWRRRNAGDGEGGLAAATDRWIGQRRRWARFLLCANKSLRRLGGSGPGIGREGGVP